MRPLKRLTEQGQSWLDEANGASASRSILFCCALVAVSPHLEWPPRPNWVIVIWYSEELTASC
jgi:hypothetical protein